MDCVKCCYSEFPFLLLFGCSLSSFSRLFARLPSLLAGPLARPPMLHFWFTRLVRLPLKQIKSSKYPTSLPAPVSGIAVQGPRLYTPLYIRVVLWPVSAEAVNACTVTCLTRNGTRTQPHRSAQRLLRIDVGRCRRMP